MAEEAELDLVEISPNAKPPVCRIMDYGKYRFELAKKQSEARKKQKQIQVKEIKFRPGTDEGDYQVKLRNLIRFLSEGDKAKVTLRFRGREMAHQDLGYQPSQARRRRSRPLRLGGAAAQNGRAADGHDHRADQEEIIFLRVIGFSPPARAGVRSRIFF
jgi:hypothetical protein